MAGFFVDSADGGVGPSGATNSFTPHNAPTCPALFYPNTCGARVTSDWLNSLISEIGQAVDNAGLVIDCGRTDNLNRSIMEHALTRGWCGASRADAESRKGSSLVPGEFFLNTSTGTVYVIDASNNEWALPNQPSSFACCDSGDIWVRCGSGWNLINPGGGVADIDAENVNVDPCPVGPVTGGDLQSVLCQLSTRLRYDMLSMAWVRYDGAGGVEDTPVQLHINSFGYYGTDSAFVHQSGNEIIFDQGGHYLFIATSNMEIYVYDHQTRILWANVLLDGDVINHCRFKSMHDDGRIRAPFTEISRRTVVTGQSLTMEVQANANGYEKVHHESNLFIIRTWA